jgi:hypothetical protein
MEAPNRFAFLRQVLFADAAASAACAVPLLLFSGSVGQLLGLPAALLFGAALSFVPFAVFVAFAARPAEPRAANVWAVIAMNAAGGVACALLAFSGGVTPNALGWAFIAFVAVYVVAMAELEYLGLRRALASAGQRRQLDPEARAALGQ